MKVVVYACTFLDYDQVFAPVVVVPGVDYVLFSDRRPRFLRVWRWRPLPEAARGLGQTMTNRYCKFFPHRLFPDADLSVYVDGNILLKGDLAPLIAEFVASDAEIGLFRHQSRASLAEELAFCVEVGKLKGADAEAGARQVAGYHAAGLPDRHVLTENAVIFRRHRDADALDRAMELWWGEMQRHTRRDQLSLPWALHVSGLRVKLWPWTYTRANAYFVSYPHRASIAAIIKSFIFAKTHYGPINRRIFTPLLAIFERANALHSAVTAQPPRRPGG